VPDAWHRRVRAVQLKCLLVCVRVCSVVRAVIKQSAPAAPKPGWSDTLRAAHVADELAAAEARVKDKERQIARLSKVHTIHCTHAELYGLRNSLSCFAVPEAIARPESQSSRKLRLNSIFIVSPQLPHG